MPKMQKCLVGQKEEMIIYKATNKINDKVYIGQTARSIKHRIKEHLKDKNVYFNDALRKYGRANFDFETMAYCDTKKKLNFLECFYIKFCNSKHPDGYNLTDGGGGILGCKYSTEIRRKMSEGRIGEKNPNWGKHPVGWNKGLIGYGAGRIVLEETRRKLSEIKTGKKIPCLQGDKHYMFGKHHSEEIRKKISTAKKGKMTGEENPCFGRTGEKHPMFGKKRPDITSRMKGNIWNKGKHPTDETRKKMSENHPDVSGEKHPMWGKHHTEETLIKMRKKHKTYKNRKTKEGVKKALQVFDILKEAGKSTTP